MRRLLPLPPVALLGVLAAVLVACGSSGSGLIPAANAGPLVGDFQAVERAARAGNGDCRATAAALSTTEHDFHLLPSSVDVGLRGRLAEGIRHLRTTALEMCQQPVATSTTSTGATSTQAGSAPPSSTSSTTGTSTTGASTTPASTTPASTTPGTTTPTEGGTAPGVGGEGQAGEGGEEGKEGQGGGEAGGGPVHEDNGVGNSGVSGNGGTGPGGH